MISSRAMEEALTNLGRFSAPGPGVTRLAYDAHWTEAHRWLAARAGELGLQATPDGVGNLLLHDGGLSREEGVILVGSHLDTVREGGLYDGAYGVVCGLFAAAELRSRTKLPVVGLVTAEEEGSRFSGDMLGSRGLLGLVEDGELDRLEDAAGVTWRQALGQAAARGCATPPGGTARPQRVPLRIAAMIEIHIEQGPVLERERCAIGIVDRIIGYHRLRVLLSGEARHAGTTPMGARRDALAAAAEMILAVEEVARRSGEPAVATAGFVRAEPGLFNVVPGTCELWIEMRHVESQALEALRGDITRRCEAIARTRGIGLALERLAGLDPVSLSLGLAEWAEATARSHGITYRVMPSGAGHDAMVFASAHIPTLLLFVPCRAGISHSPEEHADPAALWTGYTFLKEFCERLNRMPEDA